MKKLLTSLRIKELLDKCQSNSNKMTLAMLKDYEVKTIKNYLNTYLMVANDLKVESVLDRLNQFGSKELHCFTIYEYEVDIISTIMERLKHHV